MDRRTVNKLIAAKKMKCFTHPLTKYRYIPMSEVRKFGRTLAERAHRKKLRFKRMFLPMPSVTDVIRSWNQHPAVAIRLKSTEGKNHPVTNNGTPALWRAIKRARKLSGGTAGVVKEIRVYLNFCRAGKATMDRVDYSYKTLLSFLKRYCKDLKGSQRHWWRKSPIGHSKAAAFVAKRFSNYFRGADQSRYHYQDFQVVANRCFELSRQTKGRLKPNVVLQYALACLGELPGDFQTPQTMASESFWKEDLPGWLKQNE